MGITAENVATRCQTSRADQDAFALESHRRAAAAQNSGAYEAEIVPVSVSSRKGPVITTKAIFILRSPPQHKSPRPSLPAPASRSPRKQVQ
jgi:acetyl-CoA acetyltransferase